MNQIIDGKVKARLYHLAVQVWIFLYICKKNALWLHHHYSDSTFGL